MNVTDELFGTKREHERLESHIEERIQALTELGTRIGLPDRIGHLGLAPAALRRVARNAAADPASQTNPRHATQADYLDLLAQAV